MIPWDRVNWFMLTNGLLNCGASAMSAWKGEARFAVIFFCWGLSSILMATK